MKSPKDDDNLSKNKNVYLLARLETIFLFLLLIIYQAILILPARAEDEIKAGGNFAQGLPPSTEILTLDRSLEIALNENPLVLSSRDQYRAALARVNIARSFPQPSLLLDYPLMPRILSPGQSDEKFFWVNQLIEFPGRRYLRSRVASYEAQESFQDLENVKLQIAYQVKEAFFSLLLAEERLRYAKENFDLNKRFLDLVEVMHSAGEISKAEVLRARIELARAKSLIKQAETARQLAAARLNVVLGRGKHDRVQIQGELKPAPLTISFDEAKDRALLQRPEVKKVEYSLLRASLQKKQSCLSYLPDFNLGMARHKVEGIKYWDFSLSFSVPLFFWQPARGEIAEAEALIRAAQNEKSYWQDLISLEVEEAYRQALLYQEQIKLYEENILSQSEQVYEMLLFSFREGQISGLELVEARRTWLEARTSFAENLYQYAVSLALLDKAMGKIK
ncbi:MAG: TolC family protein [Candidatus Saccharicenans sp.]|uniref:TolC family protein n=1 Tax=Candidatus Saccharicenans sp. TaxID=2819258 RepID=UPI00404958F3